VQRMMARLAWSPYRDLGATFLRKPSRSEADRRSITG
jgi:hypothetical protein